MECWDRSEMQDQNYSLSESGITDSRWEILMANGSWHMENGGNIQQTPILQSNLC